MKKIFTLIAMAVIAMSANAQKITFTADEKPASYEVDGFKMTYVDEGGKISVDANNAYFGTADSYEKLGARFKTGGKSSSQNNITVTVPAAGKLKVSVRTASNSATDRNLVLTQGDTELYNKVVQESDAAKVTISDKETSVYPVIEVAVEAGDVAVTYPTGALNFYAFEFVAGGNDDPGQGGGGEGTGTTEKYVAAPDGVLAAEFAAVVDESGNATNIADGKSVVTITTDNVTVEAVGGATPADKDGGGQDITPGNLLENETNKYEVASVAKWNSISWKNGNNKTDINDVEGTKLYFVMGTGNPYINMYCEEIFTEGSGTGNYRSTYDYYKPGMDMPMVGLYYKITPKVDGTFKVQIWANKNNRNTYLINGQTKEAVPYKAEGYINGQRYTDETRPVYEADGTPKLDSNQNPVYESVQTFFTSEELQQQHDNAKVGEDGIDTAPYVIGAGNQAFWGWITFEAKAGVDYWLFQDSAQIGFGGYEFTYAGSGDTGVREIVNVKADPNAPAYNLAGQRVSRNTKGIVIINGKKYINR